MASSDFGHEGFFITAPATLKNAQFGAGILRRHDQRNSHELSAAWALKPRIYRLRLGLIREFSHPPIFVLQKYRCRSPENRPLADRCTHHRVAIGSQPATSFDAAGKQKRLHLIATSNR
jgi:hypothetical protein